MDNERQHMEEPGVAPLTTAALAAAGEMTPVKHGLEVRAREFELQRKARRASRRTFPSEPENRARNRRPEQNGGLLIGHPPGGDPTARARGRTDRRAR